MSVAEALAEVKQRMQSAASSAHRSLEDVKLIVVTKNHPASLVLELINSGVHDFGENRDQEASLKASEVKAAIPEIDVTWHFVGQLQTNKVKSVMEYAKVIHSLDRASLLAELVKQLAKQPDRSLDVFIELNLTNDSARGGVVLGNLLEFAESVLAQPQLNLLGVMGVAGLDVEPAVDFERIRQASLNLQKVAPQAKFISAGMSNDFETAIAFGATHIRVGTAITGNRS